MNNLILLGSIALTLVVGLVSSAGVLSLLLRLTPRGGPVRPEEDA